MPEGPSSQFFVFRVEGIQTLPPLRGFPSDRKRAYSLDAALEAAEEMAPKARRIRIKGGKRDLHLWRFEILDRSGTVFVQETLWF